jgi:prefoldin subunit 5
MHRREDSTTRFCVGAHIYLALDVKGGTSCIHSVGGNLYVRLTFGGDLEISTVLWFGLSNQSV